tara:strand:- start:10 stop:429 length:420 start_codon:yes stop_codon:yes gene_type:complete
MAKLDPLIRVRKHTVEQKQKTLAALYKRAQDLKDERDKLETEHAIEAEKAREMDSDFLSYFGAYSERVHNQIDTIDRARRKLENQIRLAQEQVREAFEELKKVEIVNDRRKVEERAAMDKKDSDALDEIALDGFRRKED